MLDVVVGTRAGWPAIRTASEGAGATRPQPHDAEGGIAQQDRAARVESPIEQASASPADRTPPTITMRVTMRSHGWRKQAVIINPCSQGTDADLIFPIVAGDATPGEINIEFSRQDRASRHLVNLCGVSIIPWLRRQWSECSVG